MSNKFYAIQVTTQDDEKLLCWREGKRFFFAKKAKGCIEPPAPTLFNSKKKAKKALKKIPKHGVDLNRFDFIIDCKKGKGGKGEVVTRIIHLNNENLLQ